MGEEASQIEEKVSNARKAPPHCRVRPHVWLIVSTDQQLDRPKGGYILSAGFFILADLDLDIFFLLILSFAISTSPLGILSLWAAGPVVGGLFHSAPLYSIKCMNDVVPVEYGEQPLHRSRRVPRPRLNVFPQNAPSVLYGADERILVGIIHNGPHTSTEPGFKRMPTDSFRILPDRTIHEWPCFVFSAGNLEGR